MTTYLSKTLLACLRTVHRQSTPASTLPDLFCLRQVKVQRILRNIAQVGRTRHFQAAYRNASHEDKANYISRCQAGAASWMWALPSVPDLTLTDPQCCMNLRLFLGLGTGLIRPDVPQVKSCSSDYQDGPAQCMLTERHLFRCRKTGVRHQRHSIICETVKSLMATIGIPISGTSPEEKGTDQGGPDTLVWHMPDEGKLLDVDGRDDQADRSDDVAPRAAEKPSAAAKKQEHVKREKYGRLAQDMSATLLPQDMGATLLPLV